MPGGCGGPDEPAGCSSQGCGAQEQGSGCSGGGACGTSSGGNGQGAGACAGGSWKLSSGAADAGASVSGTCIKCREADAQVRRRGKVGRGPQGRLLSLAPSVLRTLPACTPPHAGADQYFLNLKPTLKYKPRC